MMSVYYPLALFMCIFYSGEYHLAAALIEFLVELVKEEDVNIKSK